MFAGQLLRLGQWRSPAGAEPRFHPTLHHLAGGYPQSGSACGCFAQAVGGGGQIVRLLFIGGTSFVGRHAVEVAVADGHGVTVFHRGRTNPGWLDGQIQHRLGDREIGDYHSIDGRESWDAVIDVCAYVPRHVDQLADVLGGRCGHYVQVSSVSAYDPARATVHEDSPLHGDPAAGSEDVTAHYGPLKAASERAAVARFGDVAVVRPAYVCGPYDPAGQLHLLGATDGRGWRRRGARGLSADADHRRS